MLVIISQVNQKDKEFAYIYYIVFQNKKRNFRIFLYLKNSKKYIIM